MLSTIKPKAKDKALPKKSSKSKFVMRERKDD
jgi:hypothetical protein